MEILPEVEVWYGLPALRCQLAIALKARGLAQRLIAERLGLAESAVSQYLSGKRGASTLPESFQKEVLLSAERVAEGDVNVTNKELIRLLDSLRESRVICDIHRQQGGVPKDCRCCF